LRFDADGQPTGLHADRYEFWLYRQVRKRLKSGELYLDDSLQHRCFSDELVSLDAKADVLSQMDIPWLRRPIETQLNTLATELRAQWLAFNRELRQGKLKHLDYDSQTKTLTWRKPEADKNAAREEAFYEQLSFCDVADVFRFVNEQCQFLLALTPLQPRYAKRVAIRILYRLRLFNKLGKLTFEKIHSSEIRQQRDKWRFLSKPDGSFTGIFQ